jgi:hypothetical protein
MFGTLAADRTASWTLGHLVIKSSNRVASLYGPGSRTNVLILGNSVADAMTRAPLIEQATGLHAFTAAVHGLDAKTQLVLVKAYLARHPAPRFAILEVRAASSRDVMARELAMFSGQSPELIGLAEDQSRSFLPWRRIFTLTNFNSRNLPSILSRIGRSSDQSESDATGELNEAKKHTFVDKRLSVAVDPSKLKAFVETINHLQSAGTKVVVVAAPMHPVTLQLGPWAAEYVKTVKAAMPKGVTFVDGLQMVRDDHAYDDPVHMNEVGRRQFTPVIVQAMRSANDDRSLVVDAKSR